MTRSVSVASKERRRDQRRPVEAEAWLDNFPITIVDLSMSGIAGSSPELKKKGNLKLRIGQFAGLEIAPSEDEERLKFLVEIKRIDEAEGEFGAAFDQLEDEDFNLIEAMMFPRRKRLKK